MRKTEAKVGFLVIISLLALLLLSTQVNRLQLGHQDSYPIEANIGNAAGLEKYAKVKINGVVSGYVGDVYLKGHTAYARLQINKGVSVPRDSLVVLAQESMLGGRYIEITPGVAEILEPNGILENKRSLAGFDETSNTINDAAMEVKLFMQELREVLNTHSRESLQASFGALQDIAYTLRDILADNRQQIAEMILSIRDGGDSFRATSDKFGLTADTLNAGLPKVIDKTNTFLDHTDNLVTTNQKPLNNALNSMDGFFQRGDEVISKLDNYLSAIDKAELEVGMSGMAMLQDSSAKGYASIAYRPNPTRYYMLDVSNSDNYALYDSYGNYRPPNRTDKSKFYVSAQLGKRYDDVLFRGGLIEGTAGVGLDYFLLDDRLKLSFDAYDFGSSNDLRSNNMHLKATVRYNFLRYIDTYFGWDNFLNSNSQNAFVGVGIRFVDDDIKGLLGTAAGVGLGK